MPLTLCDFDRLSSRTSAPSTHIRRAVLLTLTAHRQCGPLSSANALHSDCCTRPTRLGCAQSALVSSLHSMRATSAAVRCRARLEAACAPLPLSSASSRAVRPPAGLRAASTLRRACPLLSSSALTRSRRRAVDGSLWCAAAAIGASRRLLSSAASVAEEAAGPAAASAVTEEVLLDDEDEAWVESKLQAAVRHTNRQTDTQTTAASHRSANTHRLPPPLPPVLWSLLLPCLLVFPLPPVASDCAAVHAARRTTVRF